MQRFASKAIGLVATLLGIGLLSICILKRPRFVYHSLLKLGHLAGENSTFVTFALLVGMLIGIACTSCAWPNAFAAAALGIAFYAAATLISSASVSVSMLGQSQTSILLFDTWYDSSAVTIAIGFGLLFGFIVSLVIRSVSLHLRFGHSSREKG